MGCCATKGEFDPNAPKWMDKRWSKEELQRDWKQLKAGDILLVTYRQGHPNRLIGNSRGSFWDHICIVIHGFDRSSWHDCEKHDEPYAVDCMDAQHAGPQVLEATATGVHIYNLLERVSDPEGYKYHRISYSLRRLVGVHRDKAFYETVEKLCRDTLGSEYPALIKLLGTALRSHSVEDQPEKVHCSQLCALLYQRLGLLSTEYASGNFMPSDFSSEDDGKYKVDFLMAKSSAATLTDEELFFYEGQHEEHDNARKAANNKVAPKITAKIAIK